MAADKDKVLAAAGIFFNNLLFQSASARAHGNNTRCRQLLFGHADSRYHRFRFQDHTGAAAKGRVVNSAVPVGGKIARVDAAHFYKAGIDGAFDDAVASRLFNLFRK